MRRAGIRLHRLVPLLVAFFVITCCSSSGAGLEAWRRPAHFVVTDRAVTSRLASFAATVGMLGNSLLRDGGGFEPVVYRNRFAVLQGDEKHVVIAAPLLASSPSLRSSLIDGSDIHVYRIENGEFRLVRDAVALPDTQQDATSHDRMVISLTAGNAIKSGDMVIVSKKLYSVTRPQASFSPADEKELRHYFPGLISWFSNESQGRTWQLLPYNAHVGNVDHGETYLRLTLNGSEQALLSETLYAGTSQSYYEVLEQRPYRIEIRLRCRGQGKVRLSLSGFYGEGTRKVGPIEFVPDTQWKKYTAVFTPSVSYRGTEPGQLRVEFSGRGAIDVDDLRVYRADANYLDFTPEQSRELKISGMGVLRTHGFVKTGTRTYDMAQLTASGGNSEGTKKANTLAQVLGVFKKAGVTPWLQIEPHMTDGEWSALVEYLAAPFDPMVDTALNKPWAYKRFRQGQRDPWTNVFEKIYVEFGNETWNRLMQPWIFEPMRDAVTGSQYSAGEVYGLYQEHAIRIMKRSPYWTSSVDGKVLFVLGGHAGNLQFGRDAASASPSSLYLTVGAYMGGWDEGEGPPSLGAKAFFRLLNHVNREDIPAADALAETARDLRHQHPGLLIGTYESGPGYAMNGLNGAKVTPEQAEEQELVMKSCAAGTATLDAFLARAQRGFTLQNFFTFGAGVRWSSHAVWWNGGQAHPAWRLLSLFNTQGLGEMLRVDTRTVPSADIDSNEGKRVLHGTPQMAAYATRQGTRLNLFVISRKVAGFPFADDAGYTPVVVELPFQHANSVTLYRLTGKPEASLLRGDFAGIDSMHLPASVLANGKLTVNADTGADPRGMPPASLFLYVFEGIESPRLR